MADKLQITDIFDNKQSSLSAWSDDAEQAAASEVRVDTLIGTFADNTDAPIHRWFRYQAGFSYELVAGFLDVFDIGPEDTILDPFGGVGTTVVEAMKTGATVHGVEVHPLVSWVARRKTDWNYDIEELRDVKESFSETVDQALAEKNPQEYISEDEEPEFLYKVFDNRKLGELYIIDDAIESQPERYQELLQMALVASLRDVCKAKTVFPYVQPSSTKDSTPEVGDVFSEKLEMVTEDLITVTREMETIGESTIHEIDARSIGGAIEDESVDAVITSPPYLNNVDYADVTRLELYFLGWASSWGEITETVRHGLLNSSTVVLQNVPNDVEPSEKLPESLQTEIAQKAQELKKVREGKDYSGKKYDVMVTAYFNDMYEVMNEVHNKMKSGTHFLMVLGDSAPYGVHVPTDLYLGRIGEEIGFNFNDVYEIRERGDQWKSIKGSRRHDVDLRESIVLLEKS